MPLDDTALLERWKSRRDAEAFDEIVRRFADQVFGTCRRILRNDADAEEVVQECFLLLVRSGGEVRSSLGGWLHRAATTRCLDRIRHEARRRTRESAYEQSAPKAIEVSWDDIQEHVDAAIDRLPESTRDMIVAHFLGRARPRCHPAYPLHNGAAERFHGPEPFSPDRCLGLFQHGLRRGGTRLRRCTARPVGAIRCGHFRRRGYPGR